MKTNFNVLYRVNTLLSMSGAYVDLYKDKKEFYLLIHFFSFSSLKKEAELFLKISRYDLINLIREKSNIPFIIEKNFDNEEGLFAIIDNQKELDISNLKLLEWDEIKEFFEILENKYQFYIYALHLEKKLNGRLRKEKIKSLLNE